MGDLAGSLFVDSAVSLGDRTKGADEKIEREESKPQSVLEAPSLAV